MSVIKQTVSTSTNAWAIFFDNVRVDEFVKDYTTSTSIDGSSSTATINMIYVPDFDKIIHHSNSDCIQNLDNGTSVSKGGSSKKSSSTAIKDGTMGKVVGIDSNSNLNVRSGPGTGYGVIGSLGNGADVKICKKSGDWYDIYFGTHGGWVYSKYISVTGSSGSSSGGSSSSGGKAGDNADIISDDGVENMTNVRIFALNMFSGRYVQIFGGNIRSKSITQANGQYTITFQADSYMNWLNRTICPVAVPYDGTLTTSDRLRWKAQGIDINKVKSVNTVKDITFKGKNLTQTWDEISKQTIVANKLYSSDNTVSAWDKAIDKVVIMGDIDEKLKKAKVVDFLITSSATSLSSVFVMMSDITRAMMFEFYPDRDEVIRIKPPFWNEHVLKNFVIDPSLILSYTESTNYDSYHTRVISTGSVEEYFEEDDEPNDLVKKIMTPVSVCTSSGESANSGPVLITSKPNGRSGGYYNTKTGGGVVDDSSIAGRAIEIARQFLGTPYVWGGADPSTGFDCSGLIWYAYKKAGYGPFQTGGRHTTYSMFELGTPIYNRSDLKPGDWIFPHADIEHIMLCTGPNSCIEAPQPGQNIRECSIYAFYQGRRVTAPGKASSTHPSSGNSTYKTSHKKKYEKPKDVGPNSLLEPTYLERKFGPKIYDVSQPLIKFSTAGAVDTSKDPYTALAKYSKFMLNYINASVTMSSIRTISMPWLRVGFNVWVDPIRTDKVFYVNQISHYGNAQGAYTTMNLVLGRRRVDFTGNPKILGALKPGTSDDMFVNSMKVKAEHFGPVANYDEIKKRADKFHMATNNHEVQHVVPSDSYYQYLYGNPLGFRRFGESSSSSSSSKPSPAKASGIDGEIATVTADVLNVRSGPSTSYKIIGQLYQGNSVKLFKQASGWYHIYFGEHGGWVSGDYIKRSSGGGSSSSSSSSGGSLDGKMAKVVGIEAGSFLNVRNGAGTGYAIIGSLNNGASVKLFKKQGDWYHIYFGNHGGWVSAKYISVDGSSGSGSGSGSSNRGTLRAYPDIDIYDREYTIDELQGSLNTKYSKAPQIVRKRADRLANIMKKSKRLMPSMYVQYNNKR